MITKIAIPLISMGLMIHSEVRAEVPPPGLKVVCLNPVVGDLAAQVAGSHVNIITLLPPGASPHAFRPTPADFKILRKADLILASGKGLESYLPDIRDSVANVELIEVSKILPGLIVDSSSGNFAACPHHDHGLADPHWWHSPREVQRVVRFLAVVFSQFQPDAKAHFDANATRYRDQLEELDDWAREKFFAIPESQRVLATAHSAFNYLCRDYGFKAVPVRGLNTAQTASPQHIRNVIDELRLQNIRTLFPEWNSNPSVLASLLREAHLQLAPPLLADTTDPERPGFENMFQYNVNTIASALTGENPQP